MSELLTAKQVQELLQVDRTTIYRMLDDGRLTGVKVGHQWRFTRQEIDDLIAGTRGANHRGPASSSLAEPLPLNCLQTIQDVFAEIAEVGLVTTATNGEPLTNLSNPCRFCSLIMASEQGRHACISCWQEMALRPERTPTFVACHAGLQYARARIEVKGELVGILVAGQFYAEPPDCRTEDARIRDLAAAYGLDADEAIAAARRAPILDKRKRSQLGDWLQKIARTFEKVGGERADLVDRLRQIAAMTALD
ncbi:MAG: PocR ligand-binding domain-containing protein [Chloroflexota bacterium]